MKKLLLGSMLCSSVIFADSVLLLKKGWQLIGSSTPIENMSNFTSENVSEVWHYDATKQQWLGYSPDAAIQAKMDEHNISKLTALQNWHGFWIKSKQNWTLTLKDTKRSSIPEDENRANDTIQLKKGWNLISLPVDAVVSADIFKDMTVWKYNANQEWELFDTTSTDESFPKLGHIKNSDGIWVKANKDTNISVIKEASKLQTFASNEAMERYIKEALTLYERPYCGIEPLIESGIAPATIEATDTATLELTSAEPTAQRAGDATRTNLQEEGVDESDIVKHDGVNIFYTTQGNYQKNRINITTFSRLAAGKRDALSHIEFNNQRSIDSLYLVDNRLVVLARNYGNYDVLYEDGDKVATDTIYPSYNTQQLLIDIYDVSDIDNIKKISNTQIDGSLVTSRVVGDNLYLVSQFTPQYTIKYPKEYITLSDRCKNYFENPPYAYPQPVITSNEENTSNSETAVAEDDSYDYSQYAECYDILQDDKGYYREDYENPIVSITALTPNIEGSSISKQALVKPSKLYAPSKHQQSPTITTISQFTISNGTYKQSNSFIGASNIQYASSNALYLVSEQYPLYYDFNNYKYRSMLYKFAFDDSLTYKGIGSVYGYALNQFALSEHNDILRIATTEGFSWGSSGTNNSIYTLANEAEQLNIKGVLSGLGKEGETIKSVRFMGNKGYVVTFRNTDPLYTIDLSDPTQLRKVGELEVNGYSAYLHPVGEDKLLGIGRDADAEGQLKGVKVELFDISDFANPTSLDSIIYAESTYSELEYNHKALAYRNSDNLFAFPYINYGNKSSNHQSSNYLGVHQIKENDLVSYDAIQAPNYNWGEARGLIFDMNETTYVSFFSGESIITKELNTTN